MADILIRRTPGGFRAVYPEDLPAWPVDAELMATIRLPRNIRLHKKAFALLNALWPHVMDRYPTKKALRTRMTITAGYVDIDVDPKTGDINLQAKSWAFSGMGDDEFQPLYSAMVGLAIDMVAGTNADDWESEVMEIARF
jgi:hypothetical protein